MNIGGFSSFLLPAFSGASLKTGDKKKLFTFGDQGTLWKC